MSDASVSAALRSDASLVAIEAPAGCGKTHQGAAYAKELAKSPDARRLLILTHTHAACSVFSTHTKGTGTRVEIRTIDGIIARIAAAYHVGLGLPSDTTSWVRQQADGHAALATKVAALLARHPVVARTLAQRYPVVICDEHQDSSAAQHAVAAALYAGGARLRLFADPMQSIFRNPSTDQTSQSDSWGDLTARADAFEQLDFPHRWSSGCQELGHWALAAREVLKQGGIVDLTNGLPSSVTVVVAENRAQRNLEYRLESETRRPIDSFQRSQTSLLLLTRHNRTARSLRSLFWRRIPLWEGYTRDGLDKLVQAIDGAQGDAGALAEAITRFMKNVGVGFSPSAFGNQLCEEARAGCVARRRGKPAKIQNLARMLVDEPDHRGVAKALRCIAELRSCDRDFEGIKIDCTKELYDGMRLGEFDSLEDAVGELTNRRVYTRPQPPGKAISTIHKAKGLECESVILMPCDSNTFPDSPESRCLLYVALTRAKSRLMLVVSRETPSPLLRF